MTRHLAVLGHPVGHSLSPALHTAAYRALGLPDWDYGRVDLTADRLLDWVADRDPGWVGLSLTMPLKTAVQPALADVDDTARETGAVNTVVFDWATGRHRGANTDVAGIVEALAPAPVGDRPAAVVLGNGATAESAVLALHRLGAGRVTLLVRRPGRAARVTALADRLGLAHDVVPLSDAAACRAALRGCALAVSTLPAGAADDWAAEVLVPGGLPRRPRLLDVVYATWPTVLAGRWAAAGGEARGGLEMLVAQALGQVRLFTAAAAPDAAGEADDRVRAAMWAAVGGRPARPGERPAPDANGGVPA